MKKHVEKKQTHERKAGHAPENQAGASGQAMYSPDVAVQKVHTQLANHSSQVSQLKSWQQVADISMHAKHTAQLKSISPHGPQNAIAGKADTGLPVQLQAGIENLSGYSMDDVKVHYNSAKPSQLGAHAYAQGDQIHLASGQEKHLPHEAWHVVQQKQGRVRPTVQAQGLNINNDQGLEQEADVMGSKALQTGGSPAQSVSGEVSGDTIQRVTVSDGVIQGQWEHLLYTLLTGAAGVAGYLAYRWWPAGWGIAQLRNLYQHVALGEILTFAAIPWTPPHVILLGQAYAANNPNNFTAATWVQVANACAVNAAGDAAAFAGINGWNTVSILGLIGDYTAANPANVTGAQWAQIAAACPANARADATAFARINNGWTVPQILALVGDYVGHAGGFASALWVGVAQNIPPAARPIVATILAAGLNAVQMVRAATIYINSGHVIGNVNSWIAAGAKLPAAIAAPAPGPMAGFVGVAGPYPDLHPKGKDSAKWDAYRQSKATLVAGQATMNANVAAGNTGVKTAIAGDIATVLQHYVTDAHNRNALVYANIQANEQAIDNLAYYADFYSTIPERARLTQLDTYNTLTHVNSVKLLWNRWHLNRLNGKGQPRFKEMYDSIATVVWNMKGGVHGVPDATKNPTISKYHLGAMQKGVLEGIIKNHGGMTATFNRWAGSRNYSSLGIILRSISPLPCGRVGMVRPPVKCIPTAGPPPTWALANQPALPGAKRFVKFQGKWFYSPNHYLGPAGAFHNIVQGYQLIIDA